MIPVARLADTVDAPAAGPASRIEVESCADDDAEAAPDDASWIPVAIDPDNEDCAPAEPTNAAEPLTNVADAEADPDADTVSGIAVEIAPVAAGDPDDSAASRIEVAIDALVVEATACEEADRLI